jgi:hypothetical protein
MGVVIPAGGQKLRHNEFSARIGFGGHEGSLGCGDAWAKG